MAIERDSFEKRLSGGAANTDPDLSLGGAMSTEIILSQTAVYSASALSGVSLVEGRGNLDPNVNPITDASLAFLFTTTELTWEPPSSSVGDPIDVSVDGRYVIPGPFDQSILIVDVVSANLPLGDESRGVDIQTPPNSMFDDVGAIEAFLGVINYRGYYVRNDSGVDTLFGVKVYIGSQPSPASDTLDIGLDPAGINGVATTIVDELTAPAGVSFTQPGAYASGLLIGDLTPGDNHAIWIRRTVPPGSIIPAPRDLSSIIHGMLF